MNTSCASTYAHDTPPTDTLMEQNTPLTITTTATTTTKASATHEASFTKRLADRGVAVPSSFSTWQHRTPFVEPSFSSSSLSNELDPNAYYGLSPFVTSSFSTGIPPSESSPYTSLRHRYEKESQQEETSSDPPPPPPLPPTGTEDSDIELSDNDLQENTPYHTSLHKDTKSASRPLSPLTLHQRNKHPSQPLDSLLGQGTDPPHQGLVSPRTHLLQAPVLQVVYANSIKDRYLFLFNDLLLICKPIMDESIIAGSPVHPDNETTSRLRSSESSLFQVKSIVELAKMTLFLSRQDHSSLGGQEKPLSNEPRLARRMHPMLAFALRQFESSAEQGVQYLMEKHVLTQDPLSIANFLFKTPDLNRRQLGYYLSDRRNHDTYEAFLDCFRLVGLRLDEALRILLTTFRLPSQWELLEYIIEQFAKKWHDANQNVVKFHEDMVVKVIVAMLFLNAEVWYDASSERDVFWFARERKEQQDRHRLRRGSIDTRKHRGSVAFEPLHYIASLRSKGPKRPTVDDFLERWSYYDQYTLVPREFMEDMFRSIRAERLETGWESRPGETEERRDIVITVDAQCLPSRLTRNVPCLPIQLSIPSPDPGLQIKLRGQDLVCQPNLLDFSQSPIQSFTVTGHTLGRTGLMFIKSGFNAGRYVSPTLPRTKSVVVERPFMRYTFQIGFHPHDNGSTAMHKYTFSVESEEERHTWVEHLRQLCGVVVMSSQQGPVTKETPKEKTAEEKVALQVLREVLLAEDMRKHSLRQNANGFEPMNLSVRSEEEQGKEESRLLPSTTHAVAKRGHEIVHLVVQNALVPHMLGFLKSQIQ